MASSSASTPGLPRQLTRGPGGWLVAEADIAAQSVASVLALEQRAAGENLSPWALMRRAGDAAWRLMQSRWPRARSATIVCGSGNNGGDGCVLAALAARAGWRISLIDCGSGKAASPAAGQARRMMREAQVSVRSAKQWLSEPDSSDLLVDALLGTGLRDQVRADAGKILHRMGRSRQPVLALDIPSGLQADTGRCLGPVARAEATVTFIAAKPGLLTGEGRDFCGALYLSTLGLPDDWLADPSRPGQRFPLLLPAVLRKTLSAKLRRRAHAHKNQLGCVLVAGGDEGMSGAALLAAETALRCGAGLVTAAAMPSALAGFLARCPEIMAHPIVNGQDLEPLLERADAVVLGPGLGESARAEQFVQRALAAAGDGQCRLIIDAGALRLLTPGHRWRKQLPAGCVLTPHVGEAAALLGSSAQEVAEDRFAAVRTLVAETRCTLVLKGSGTLVGAPDEAGIPVSAPDEAGIPVSAPDKAGGGVSIGICPYGNPGMATAGCGDVLAGLTGALLGRGLEYADAARLAVAAHAAAGDQAVQTKGAAALTASDLSFHLPAILEPSD